MANRKIGGKRNYGFGKQLGFAAKNIIADMHGDGRYGTTAAYNTRINCMNSYLEDFDVRDYRDLDLPMFKQYAKYLRDRVNTDDLAVATGVNYLSAANCFMAHARQDNVIALSPKETIGPREYVRQAPPVGLRISRFSDFLESNWQEYSHGAALMVSLGLCRFAGARFREASLMPLPKALRSFCKNRRYSIVEGTKGGRRLYRPVPAQSEIIESIVFAKTQLNRGCVIPKKFNFKRWSSFAYRNMPRLACELGISQGFHDLRASYACERYREITGHDAPAVAGKRMASKEADLNARQILSTELGHSRIQIMVSYVGSAR